MLQLQSAFGVLALLAIAWALSENRRAVSLRQAAVGLAVTVVTALALLKLPLVAHAFGAINDAVGTISAASRAGTSFVFGYLGGGALPFDLEGAGRGFHPGVPGAADGAGHERADDAVVLLAASCRRSCAAWHGCWSARSASAARWGLSTAANIFLGMVEAPLFIRPYLAQLTRSELFLVMTGGMAGIAGTVLVLYATLLAPLIPDAAAHFVIASVLGAPGGDPGQPDHGAGNLRQAHRRRAERSRRCTRPRTMDAIVKGTTAGLELLLNIVAMLLVLVALVYLANAILGPAARYRRRDDLAAADARLS